MINIGIVVTVGFYSFQAVTLGAQSVKESLAWKWYSACKRGPISCLNHAVGYFRKPPHCDRYHILTNPEKLQGCRRKRVFGLWYFYL
jgi:hypothetical protein